MISGSKDGRVTRGDWLEMAGGGKGAGSGERDEEEKVEEKEKEERTIGLEKRNEENLDQEMSDMEVKENKESFSFTS